MNAPQSSVPQVIAILSCATDGTVRLKKTVKTYLGLTPGKNAAITTRPEIIMRARSNKPHAHLILDDKDRIQLPAHVVSMLKITARSLVALIERPDGLAIKRFEVLEKAGTWARLVDLETPYTLARIVYTNPPPVELRPALIAQYQGVQLKYDVSAFLRERATFEAWRARRILGAGGPAEEQRRRSLIAERLKTQREDGSWQGQVAITARYLRELEELGLTQHDRPLCRAVDWLLARPESQYNAGMFFGKDELVAEQACIMEQIHQGQRARFRKIRTSEQNLVRAADQLIQRPCGPRIMWPNALVVEALLRLGCEKAPRVQRALETMLHEWCECSYQHGSGAWRKMSEEDVKAYEDGCLLEFIYGGVRALRTLEQADMSRTPFEFPRIAHCITTEGEAYPLAMPRHLQGCEVITTRALSRVSDAQMKRFAEAHLWRFASRQRPEGQFASEKYGHGLSPAGFLEMFARYQHPASTIVALRAIPWIINSQNDDGSWGEGTSKDADTCAVVSVLASLREHVAVRI